MTESEYEIIDCICSWYDLLGYGQPLIDSNWNLKDKRCLNQLKRIEQLDLTHVNIFSSARETVSFTLNDGVILNYDINLKKNSFIDQLVSVLDDLLLEYDRLNVRDTRAGHPGVRGIITFGHRYDYIYAESTVNVSNKFTTAFHPRVFQMNTAFSKAYIIESSGSRLGISGNNLYIDKYLLEKIEYYILEKNDSSINYKVEKNLTNKDDKLHFTVYRGNKIFLKLLFDQNFIEYVQKGINTYIYRFISKISLQEQLATESAFREGQRYLQLEKEEFGEE